MFQPHDNASCLSSLIFIALIISCSLFISPSFSLYPLLTFLRRTVMIFLVYNGYQVEWIAW